MVGTITSEEFIGRFVTSYKDGEIIYAYDEITHGLYSFSFDLRKVRLVLSPESIHRNSADKIVGIAKSGDEIILIPSYLDSEWIFFDVKKEKARYNSPLTHRVHISCTIIIGSILFLIPANTSNPVVIFSLDKMKVIKVYEKWNKQLEEKAGNLFWIWGASSFEDCVIFPMVDSYSIGCINPEAIKVITADIPERILSVSVYGDRIWVLPTSGEYVYALNFKGEMVDKINLLQSEAGGSANSFVRIVAIEDNIFLLPVYGGNLCVYQCRRNKVLQLEKKKECLRGRLYEENPTPYWEYVVENEILHILPCDYHYIRINMHSLDSEEYSLGYGDNINYDRYWEMMGNIQKECVLEKRKGDLKDFLQYLFCAQDRNCGGEDKRIGEKIWENGTCGYRITE